MQLWTVLHRSADGEWVVEAHVVRAATADAAIALAPPWGTRTATAEPLTYEGEPGVILSDTR